MITDLDIDSKKILLDRRDIFVAGWFVGTSRCAVSSDTAVHFMVEASLASRLLDLWIETRSVPVIENFAGANADPKLGHTAGEPWQEVADDRLIPSEDPFDPGGCLLRRVDEDHDLDQ
jgi:hypothetical protein